MCYNFGEEMRIDELDWDDVNIEHIMVNHYLNPKEVEDVCFGSHYVIPAEYKRKAVYGQTSGGKYIVVILERLYNNIFRPITARGMKRNEQTKYKIIMRLGSS